MTLPRAHYVAADYGRAVAGTIARAISGSHFRAAILLSGIAGLSQTALGQTGAAHGLTTSPVSVGSYAEARRPQPPRELRDADVFLGVDAGGNTTPGAQVPFGFVVLQPDTERMTTAGYSSGNRILGFSSTHESGTGGASKYGNFRVMPSVGDLQLPVSEDGHDEVAWPGYYAVSLGTTAEPIRAELTATRLVGFHRYTFPRVAKANLVIEVSSVIAKWNGDVQRPLACHAQTDEHGRINGTCKFTGGWNPGEYQLYFATQFDHAPLSTSVNTGSDIGGTAKDVKTGVPGEPLWASATFDATDNPTAQMKLAVSFLSADKARANLREVEGLDFDGALEAAEQQWISILGKIDVEGGTPAQRNIFASALYRAHVMPHDVSGENVWWTSSEPHYEDYYTLWDTFRTQDPLITLLEPDRGRDLVRSMVDTYVHTGWMPDARVAGSNGLTQGGSNGDVLVADALAKGLTGIDYKTAYEALVKNAETDSPDPMLYGRKKMSTYKALGYLPFEEGISSSRTMEYSYDDFAISTVAAALGKTADAEKYRTRSLFWTNLWDDQAKSVHPRYADGHFSPDFDRSFTFGSWNGPFYEGSPWQYSTYVPHDVQGLINRVGGDAAFVAWLDDFFAHDKYDPGNEPDMLAGWLYIHAGRPDKSQDVVRRLLDRYYHTGRQGLPGNDDSGAMTSWFVWSAMGLYPNAGQAYYYVGSPVFSKVTILVGSGRTFTIEAPNSSPRNRYIQSATLDGTPLDRAWLKHTELMKGGVLRLELGPEPSSWGRGQRPYSVEAVR